jgi:hypothetical protein
MQDVAEITATQDYDLAELLKDPEGPLTANQWNNFDRYMRMTNDDKSAADVDIGPAIERRVKEIKEKGTFWR